MKGCEAVAEFQGDCPGWVAVIVTLPFQTGYGVSIGRISTKGSYRTVITVEAKDGKP